jgi:hypothetical protein
MGDLEECRDRSRATDRASLVAVPALPSRDDPGVRLTPVATNTAWSYDVDEVFGTHRIRTVLCNIQTPRLNAIAERWIGGCRRELLDRTLIWNQAHLRRILSDYETHHNQHRSHRSLYGAAPLKPLPEPVDLDLHRIRRRAQVGGLINEYRLVA